MLTREQILGITDIQIEELDVPEWGGKIYVKALTGAERDAFESSVIEMRGSTRKINMRNVRAKLASMAICDEKGNRLFTDADVEALSKKSASALDKIFTVASRLSGISSEDEENLRKNLSLEVGDSTSV